MTELPLDQIAGRVIESCSSTNDLARRLGEAGYPHGTWVSARQQDAGRGRLGRRWESLSGNLLLSLILRIESKTLWTWTPLAAAVGAARTLNQRFPELDVRIKWPNDLWAGAAGLKLGGILCEGVGTSRSAFVIVGIGVNCAEFPGQVDPPATSISARMGRPVEADEVRPLVIEAIINEAAVLSDHGPAQLAARYDESAVFRRGTAVQWGNGRTGVVEGLGEAGELKVVADGRLERLYAEDVRAVRIKTVPKEGAGSPA